MNSKKTSYCCGCMWAYRCDAISLALTRDQGCAHYTSLQSDEHLDDAAIEERWREIKKEYADAWRHYLAAHRNPRYTW